MHAGIALPVLVALLDASKPDFVSVTVIVALPEFANPLLVIVLPDLLTEPDVVEMMYVEAASKLVITTVKEPNSEVAAASAGVAIAVNEVPVVLAEFWINPALLTVTVHVAVVSLAKLVTVTAPDDCVALPLFVTENE